MKLKHVLCVLIIKLPQQGAPQHMFSWRNKENIKTFLLKKKTNKQTAVTP